jgi:hypothetical protein
MFSHPSQVMAESMGHTAHESLAVGEIGSLIAGAMLYCC